MTQKERARLLLSTLRKSKLTANELIDKIWHKDPDRKDRHYKFYLHLNKLFAPLEKLGFLTVCDKKKGETWRMEKVWKRTDKSLNDLSKCSLGW